MKNKKIKIGEPTISRFFIMVKKIIIGVLAGLVCGLFSTGGGLVLVPSFIYFLYIDDKKARGTATFCILPMVIICSFMYYRFNYIEWKTSFLCAIGGIVGGYIGGKILNKINPKYLKIIFIIFLLYISYKMLW